MGGGGDVEEDGRHLGEMMYGVGVRYTKEGEDVVGLDGDLARVEEALEESKQREVPFLGNSTSASVVLPSFIGPNSIATVEKALNPLAKSSIQHRRKMLACIFR